MAMEITRAGDQWGIQRQADYMDPPEAEELGGSLSGPSIQAGLLNTREAGPMDLLHRYEQWRGDYGPIEHGHEHPAAPAWDDPDYRGGDELPDHYSAIPKAPQGPGEGPPQGMTPTGVPTPMTPDQTQLRADADMRVRNQAPSTVHTPRMPKPASQRYAEVPQALPVHHWNADAQGVACGVKAPTHVTSEDYGVTCPECKWANEMAAQELAAEQAKQVGFVASLRMADDDPAGELRRQQQNQQQMMNNPTANPSVDPTQRHSPGVNFPTYNPTGTPMPTPGGPTHLDSGSASQVLNAPGSPTPPAPKPTTNDYLPGGPLSLSPMDSPDSAVSGTFPPLGAPAPNATLTHGTESAPGTPSPGATSHGPVPGGDSSWAAFDRDFPGFNGKPAGGDTAPKPGGSDSSGGWKANEIGQGTIGAGDYKINSGDTLSEISKGSGVSVDDLAKSNSIADPNKINAGDTLKIPGSGADTAGSGAGSNTSLPSPTTSSGAEMGPGEGGASPTPAGTPSATPPPAGGPPSAASSDVGASAPLPTPPPPTEAPPPETHTGHRRVAEWEREDFWE